MLAAATIAGSLTLVPGPVSAEGLFDFFFGGAQRQQTRQAPPQGNFFTDPFGLNQQPHAYQSEAGNASKRAGLVQSGNYLLRFDNGPVPGTDALRQLASQLPERHTTAPPPLHGYMPEKGRIAGSERYALGPTGLTRFESRIPTGMASFERGAEAELARYKVKGTELQLTVLQYPTPQIAI